MCGDALHQAPPVSGGGGHQWLSQLHAAPVSCLSCPAALPHCRRRGSGRWWKVPLVLLSLAAAGAGGYYGWKYYEEQQDKKGSKPQDKKGGKPVKKSK